MNSGFFTTIRLLLILLIPMIIVTLGGFIVYQTPQAFFFADPAVVGSVSNSPAMMYYALTLVISLMVFLMREKHRWFEIIAFTALSAVFSLSLKGLTPVIHRPVYLFFVPMMVFFIIAWLILKYIYLNPKLRTIRLLLFALLNAAGFTLAFYLMNAILGNPADNIFLQSRYISGLMLFIFMGFGLINAEAVINRMDRKANSQPNPIKKNIGNPEPEEHAETD